MSSANVRPSVWLGLGNNGKGSIFTFWGKIIEWMWPKGEEIIQNNPDFFKGKNKWILILGFYRGIHNIKFSAKNRISLSYHQ